MYKVTNWRDAEEWFGEDPHATFLTLTAMVIEDLTE